LGSPLSAFALRASADSSPPKLAKRAKAGSRGRAESKCPASARRREKSWWRRHALRRRRRRRLLCTPLLLLLLPSRLSGRFRRCFCDSWALSAFAVGDPDVIDRVLDCVQARTCGEHPSGKNSLDLSLQRHLVDLDKRIRIWRFRRRARIAHAWRHLQSAELHRFVDRNIERNDAPCDLVEACKHCRWIGDALRRRFDGHRIAWLWRRVRRLRNVARGAWTWRQGGRRLTWCNGGPLWGLAWRRLWRNYSPGRGWQRLRLNVALAGPVRWRQVHWCRQRLRWRSVTAARVVRRRLLPG
jgi:hypothetical protein